MKNLVCMLAVFSAVSMLSVRAGDDVDDLLDDLSDKGAEAADGGSDEGSDESSDEGADPAADADDTADGGDASGEGLVRAAGGANKDKHFHILPFGRRLDLASSPDRPVGSAEVLTPMAKEWAPVKEGKFYPLGSTYRTTGPDTKLRMQFGTYIEVEINGDAQFGTRAQALGEKSRTIVLGYGTIDVKLPRNLPEGLFVVTAPSFKAINLAGESRYTHRRSEDLDKNAKRRHVGDGDGEDWLVRCVTGTLTVEGRHFRIPAMKAAQEVEIRASQDLLFTGLYGKRGDYIVRLDQGRVQVKDYETGKINIEDKVLDWKLSPQTAVRIHRAVPALGERMSVTVMTFDAAGELKNRCAFAEKLVEVNSGELGPTSKKDREELAKKAAEATVNVAAEGEGESGDAAPTEEKADAGSDGAAADDIEF